jgi:hypothetical protein
MEGGRVGVAGSQRRRDCWRRGWRHSPGRQPSLQGWPTRGCGGQSRRGRRWSGGRLSHPRRPGCRGCGCCCCCWRGCRHGCRCSHRCRRGDDCRWSGRWGRDGCGSAGAGCRAPVGCGFFSGRRRRCCRWPCCRRLHGHPRGSQRSIQHRRRWSTRRHDENRATGGMYRCPRSAGEGRDMFSATSLLVRVGRVPHPTVAHAGSTRGGGCSSGEGIAVAICRRMKRRMCGQVRRHSVRMHHRMMRCVTVWAGWVARLRVPVPTRGWERVVSRIPRGPAIPRWSPAVPWWSRAIPRWSPARIARSERRAACVARTDRRAACVAHTDRRAAHVTRSCRRASSATTGEVMVSGRGRRVRTTGRAYVRKRPHAVRRRPARGAAHWDGAERVKACRQRHLAWKVHGAR